MTDLETAARAFAATKTAHNAKVEAWSQRDREAYLKWCSREGVWTNECEASWQAYQAAREELERCAMNYAMTNEERRLHEQVRTLRAQLVTSETVDLSPSRSSDDSNKKK